MVCVVLVASASAAAQLSVFEGEVTVTATGTEEQVDEVPVSVTVIDRTEIDHRQEDSVADLLRRAPGVTVARSGDEGAATSLFTRGTESDHTLAMFDGVRLNSPYFGGYDWSLLPTAGLQRVEVARGPYSALWGADAIGGVVNVVPARAVGGLSAAVLAEGGEDSWQRLEGSLGWAGNGFDVYASGFDRQGEGELDNSDFANRQVLLDAGWSWAEGSRVAVLVQDLRSDIGIPFTDPVTVTPNRRQSTDQRLVALPLRLRLGERWDLELVASQVNRELRLRDPDDPWGFTRSDTGADTVQARLASRHRLGDHRLAWGGEWREDEVGASSSFGTSLDGATSTVSSLFVQDTWRVADSVRVLAGVRWDEAEEWGSEISPRLSAGWSPGGSVELRVGYGRGFRQPSVGELYFPGSGNPELEAERSESAELGATWFTGSLRWRASLFSTRVDNLVEFDYVTSAFANVSEAEMRGVELSLDLPLSDRLVSLLQTTWLDTEGVDGLALLRRPDWSASWTVHGALWKRLSGSATVIWVGSRPDVDPITFARTELDGHLTGNLSLALEVVRHLEVTVRVHNVGDAAYEEVAGYPAPGRRVTGGLRWRL
jgi:vitamin B12 transporter